MIWLVTKYYNIQSGKVTIGCDGLGPLHRCFKHEWDPSPATPHYDLIKATRTMARSTPISWQWVHIKGHQDQDPNQPLDEWANLNIEMDTAAKQEWDLRQACHPQDLHVSIPGEGWAIYTGIHKATSWSKCFFHDQVQQRYSEAYWKKPSKLGHLFDLVDWDSIGHARARLPPLHRV